MLPECELMNICMIIDRSTNRVLMQRRDKKRWPGLAFPGGHVEPGESFGESVVREVREETGLEISNVKLNGIVHWEHSRKHCRSIIAFYSTDTYSGVPRETCEEGTHIWVPLAELANLQLAPWLKEQLVVYENDAVSEIFYVYDDDGVQQVRTF